MSTKYIVYSFQYNIKQIAITEIYNKKQQMQHRNPIKTIQNKHQHGHHTPKFSPKFQSSSHEQPQSSFQQRQQSQQANNDTFYCQTCCHYQQDIAILQQKLLDIHNKLLEQIDISRSKQLQIVRLKESSNSHKNSNKKMASFSQQNPNENKSPGKIVSALKYDHQYYQHQHSVEPLMETKNQLLKNDLQTMRNKVLSEIMKNNQLSQQLSTLKGSHQHQLLEYRDKIHKIEQDRSRLIQQNQVLQQQLKNMIIQNSSNKNVCCCGFQQKYYELDEAFMNQRSITNQLIQQNSEMQNRFHELRVRAVKQGNNVGNNVGNSVDNHGDNSINGKYDARRGDKKTVRKQDNKGVVQSQSKKNTVREKEKRNMDFQETKNLIYKLEEAERSMRYRK